MSRLPTVRCAFAGRRSRRCRAIALALMLAVAGGTDVAWGQFPGLIERAPEQIELPPPLIEAAASAFDPGQQPNPPQPSSPYAPPQQAYAPQPHRYPHRGAPQMMGQPAPRRLPAVHCDEPGAFAPEPCPPAAPAPPKRQVHHVFVQPPCPPAAAAPAMTPPAQQAAPQLPAGAFVAPPQAGSVVQEQSSLGIRGMRITFPSLSFELPSIELPYWIRRGRAAHMELAGGTAPYVAGAGVAQYAMPRMAAAPAPAAQPPLRRPPAPPQAQQPPQQDVPPPAADQPTLQEDFEQLQQRCQRLEQLLEKMIQCQQQTAGMLPPPQSCPPPLHRISPPPQACPPSPHGYLPGPQ